MVWVMAARAHKSWFQVFFFRFLSQMVQRWTIFGRLFCVSFGKIVDRIWCLFVFVLLQMFYMKLARLATAGLRCE